MTSPPYEPKPESREPLDPLSQSDSQASQVPLGQSNRPVTPPLSSSSVVDLTVASITSPMSSSFSSSSSGVDAFGTPYWMLLQRGTISTASPSFDLVRAADDEKVICGAAVQTMKPNTPPSSLNDQADKVLDEWRQHTVDWAPTAVLHSADDTKTPDDFTPLLLSVYTVTDHLTQVP
ncbi:hypothetical protein PI125_g10253 [Phytophthora idaei]|nr:hypothetical protein PI125_g10253 [Phytophthora idaei]KAG3154459.1 hypothetical protein PI126_g9612 [Phytophthora idaei]